MVFNPGEIDFGAVAKGQSPAHFIDVEHAGDASWRILEILKNGSAPFDMKVEQLPQRVEPPNPIAPWRFRVRATCCVAGSRSSIWLPRRMAVSRRTFTRPNFGNSETLGRNRLSRHFYCNP